MNILPFEGTLDRAAFDFGIELLISGTTVRLEGHCEATLGDGAKVAFEADAAQDVASTIVGLLNSRVSVSLVGDVLTVQAAEGDYSLSAFPEVEFEAWSLVTSDGSRLVSSAGGAPTEWS